MHKLISTQRDKVQRTCLYISDLRQAGGKRGWHVVWRRVQGRVEREDEKEINVYEKSSVNPACPAADRRMHQVQYQMKVFMIVLTA